MRWGISVFLIIGMLPKLALAQADEMKRFVGEFTLVDVPVSTAYNDWTTAKGLNSFLTQEADINLRPGGDYSLTLRYRVQEMDNFPTNGKILSLQANKMIATSWDVPVQYAAVAEQQTFVQIWFDPVGPNRTLIRVEQHGFGTGQAWDNVYEYYDDVWRQIMDAYKSHRTGKDDD